MFDPTSSKTTGYHLFFEPVGIVAEEVSAIMQTLANEYGGPVFNPHVTLLARIPKDDESVLVQRTIELAQSMRPFSLTLDRLDAKKTYFGALYMKIKEQEEVQILHRNAAHIFLMEENPEYLAHMSLLYGNYSLEMKEKTIAELTVPQTREFQVHSVHLYRTEGETAEWYQVQECAFGA